MSHPYNSVRNDKVQKSRVSGIAKGCGGSMAAGGSAHSDIAEDKSLVRKMVKKVALRATGGGVKARADRPSRARGGRLGKKKSSKGNHVNVIIGAHPPAPPAIPGVGAMPPPGLGAAPPMPPKPPMMPPPGPSGPGMGGPPMPGAGMPPGVPPPGIRYAGGRTRAKGGKVEAGSTPSKAAFTTKGKGRSNADGNLETADTAGIGQGRTPVQHSRGKQDGVNIGRPASILKATGGPISSNYAFKKGMAPHAKGGAMGGLAKLDKANHPSKYIRG